MSLDGVRRGQSGFVVLNNEYLPWVGKGLAAESVSDRLTQSENILCMRPEKAAKDRRSRTVVKQLGWCRSAFNVKDTSSERRALQPARRRIPARKQAQGAKWKYDG